MLKPTADRLLMSGMSVILTVFVLSLISAQTLDYQETKVLPTLMPFPPPPSNQLPGMIAPMLPPGIGQPQQSPPFLTQSTTPHHMAACDQIGQLPPPLNPRSQPRGNLPPFLSEKPVEQVGGTPQPLPTSMEQCIDCLGWEGE